MSVIPGKSEHDDMMIRFHHCLDGAMELWRELKAEDEMLFQDAVLETLAARCCEMGLPIEFASRRARFCNVFTQDWDTINVVFDTQYMRGHFGDAPEGFMPKSALMAFRTEAYMKEHYELRKNVMTGTPEYKQLGLMFSFQPLTKEARNTMTIKALKAGIDSWDRDINRYIESELIATYEPIFEYLTSLPKWDGKDRVTPLAKRVKTDAPHWVDSFHKWMQSMVAQWMGKNKEHGNAIVPLLIGPQGSGKTTFCRRLLPEELQSYFNDRLPMKNDNDIYIGMSSYALINLDEFDAMSKSQQPILKYLLSKHDVKMRPPFGKVVEQRKRYASFIATTNNLHPLVDPTGSRRFLCVYADKIDNKGDINHKQIFAQLVEELRNNPKLRYWFTDAETKRLIEYNNRFFKARDFATMVSMTFALPENTPDDASLMTMEEIMRVIVKQFPEVVISDGSKRRMGIVLKELGYEKKRSSGLTKYKMVSSL